MRKYISYIFIKIFIFSTVAFLNACTTQDPFQEAERLASRQASHIRQHLPIKSGSYTWIEAQNKGAVINITLINTDASAAKSQTATLEHTFPQKMCEQSAVIALLAKGVTYQIIINPESRNPHQLVLNAQTCNAVHA